MLLDHIVKTDCTSHEMQWLRLREEGCWVGMVILQSLSYQPHKTRGLECIAAKLFQPLQSFLQVRVQGKPGHRVVSGWAALRRLACFKYLAQNVFSSPFSSGELDQDKASMTLAQSQEQAVTLGKPALRAKGKKFPFCSVSQRMQSKGSLARSAKLPPRRRCSVKKMWPLRECRRQELGCTPGSFLIGASGQWSSLIGQMLLSLPGCFRSQRLQR